MKTYAEHVTDMELFERVTKRKIERHEKDLAIEQAQKFSTRTCGGCDVMKVITYSTLGLMVVNGKLSIGDLLHFSTHAIGRVEQLERDNKLLRERLDDLARDMEKR